MAKLYTAPYSHIEVSDEKGQITRVNVEELSGAGVVVDYAFNAAFPWLKLSANVANMGGAAQTINFSNVTSHDIKAGGRWYQTLRSWDVPCFKVCQVASETYDYQQHFNVEQQKKNAETTYTNSINSIETSYNNAIASNQTSYDNTAAANNTAQVNANNNATLVTANNAITVAANTTTTQRSIDGNLSVTLRANTKMDNDASADVAMSSASYAADQAAIGTAGVTNLANAASGMINVLASTATGALGGAAVGAAAGGVGAIPGAVIGGVAGLATTSISAATGTMSNVVSQSNNSDIYGATISQVDAKKRNAKTYATDATSTTNNVMLDNTSTTNTASTSIAENSANNSITNAANTRSTSDANNGRSKNTADANAERNKFTNTGNAQRTRSNALAAVQAGVDNAGMQAANAFGIEQAGEYSSTRPQVLSVNVVTESKNAIAQAATQFKRWGYTLNQAFNFETWGLMKHFTFWQVSDVWATGPGSAPEEGQDAVRNMLYSGVTCWKNPAEIGTVSIYDN